VNFTLSRNVRFNLLLCVQSSECGQTCEAVAKATEFFPPQLAGQGRGYDDVTAGRAGLQLDGSWASRRCESRPYGVQLTRHYQFDELDNTWSSRHNYYSDVSCRHQLYSLDVAGVFSLHNEPSPLLDDSYHIDFNVSNLNRNFVLVTSLCYCYVVVRVCCVVRCCAYNTTSDL